MKVAIVVFPGTSCGEEMYTVCSNQLKLEAVYVRENEANLDDYDAILLPGGASYGDAIRPGAIAALQPVMSAIKRTRPGAIAALQPVMSAIKRTGRGR